MNNISNQIKLQKQTSVSYRIFSFISLIGLEGFIWIAALIYLAFSVNPYETHFTICPLSNAGFEHCPGCGLGNSIALFFKGKIIDSFNTHILGIPALVIILRRIYSIIIFNLRKEKITIK